MTCEAALVLYLPSGVEIDAEPGDTLLDAALAHRSEYPARVRR